MRFKDISGQRFDHLVALSVASLDRIDRTKGYEPGNVQWVHKIVNDMKGTLKDADFIAWCGAVASHVRTIRPLSLAVNKEF